MMVEENIKWWQIGMACQVLVDYSNSKVSSV